MIIAVSGWRSYDPERLPWVIRRIRRQMMSAAIGNSVCHLRFGDCPTGVDPAVRSWAKTLVASFATSFEYVVRDPWPQAGPLRNRRMLAGEDETGLRADLLLAFPEPGKRRPRSGTWDCIDAAAELSVETTICHWKEDTP